MKPLFATFTALTCVSPCFADPGMVSLASDDGAGRGLGLSVWYPAQGAASVEVGGNAVFRGAAATPGAPVADGVFPLVLISHGGARSAADSGAWLSAGLAEAGYIAVEVNPPRPRGATEAVDEIWRRPEDLGRALGVLLDHREWSGRIDSERVSVVGFALGGTAALALAGGAFDVDGHARSCEGAAEAAGPDCAWFAAQGVTPATVDREQLAAPRRDPRIGAAVAISPEYADITASASIEIPTLVLALGEADGAGREPTLTEASIAGASGFDAFPVCAERGARILAEEGGDPAICGDSTAARERVHAEILAGVTTFLETAE